MSSSTLTAERSVALGEKGAASDATSVATFRLGGMDCAACAGVIAGAIRAIAGVDRVDVSAASRCATVRWQASRTSAGAIADAVAAAGYAAVPDTAAHARAMRRDESRAALWRLFVAAFCAMQIMMLAAPSYLAAAGELAPDLRQLLAIGSWMLTLPVLAFSARPFLEGARRSIASRRIGMDVPVALGIVVAFVASSGAVFDPGGPFGHEVYFDSVAMFVSFLLAGRWLELRMRHRAEEALENATDQIPRASLRLTEAGGIESVATDSLSPGDRVRVFAGDAFPADGTLIEGTTTTDESIVTGESRPLAKSPGDPLIAGSRNVDFPVVMRVEQVGADTRYEAICSLMRAVRTSKPKLLAQVDRWASPFVWFVLFAAACAGAVWSVVDPARALWVVVSVLIVTCPCALSLAAPSALLAAAGAMGRRGVLLRRIDAIEAMARVDTIYIDKTGTLTECRREQVSAVFAPGTGVDDRPALEALAASLAGWSTHPLSRAIAATYPPSSIAWQHVREVAGRWIEATDETQHRWRLGAPPDDDVPAASSAAARVCLSVDGEQVASFFFDEVLRPDAASAVAALQHEGVEVRILSGDDPERVAAIAALLGVDGVGAQSPDAKLAAVRSAQRDGRVVAMIGDGVNDGPVLAQADVSFAMGDGASLARGEADGVLTFNRFADVMVARTLARKALRIVRQNFAWAATYNAACIPLALTGHMPPWLAGAGMAASSLLVVTNSFRLSRGPRNAHTPPAADVPVPS